MAQPKLWIQTPSSPVRAGVVVSFPAIGTEQPVEYVPLPEDMDPRARRIAAVAFVGLTVAFWAGAAFTASSYLL
jgi:hypothetical protein